MTFNDFSIYLSTYPASFTRIGLRVIRISGPRTRSRPNRNSGITPRGSKSYI